MSRPNTSTPSEAGFPEIAAASNDPHIIRELFRFLKANKKWWLLPIILVVLMMALTVYLSGAAPFIYTLF